MVSAIQLPSPMELSSASSSGKKLLPEACEAQFELGITLSLFLWAPLSLAVINQWGGPDSADKREWFASETISQLQHNPDADTEWIETWLLQVMLDEFEVNIDDESGFELAEQIVRLRNNCENGSFEEVGQLQTRWNATGGKGLQGQFQGVERDEADDETDASEDEDEDEDRMDVEIEEAPQLVTVNAKVEPEVDEDGFTKVIRKKK